MRVGSALPPQARNARLVENAIAHVDSPQTTGIHKRESKRHGITMSSSNDSNSRSATVESPGSSETVNKIKSAHVGDVAPPGGESPSQSAFFSGESSTGTTNRKLPQTVEPAVFPLRDTERGELFHLQLSHLQKADRDENKHFDPLFPIWVEQRQPSRSTPNVRGMSLVDTGYINGGASVCSSDWAFRVIRSNSVCHFEQFAGPLSHRRTRITVANKQTIQSIGRLKVTLCYADESSDSGVYRMKVDLDVYDELTCDVIISNRDLARQADCASFNFKRKHLKLLNEDSHGNFTTVATLTAPKSSYRTLPELTAARYDLRTPADLVLEEAVEIDDDERLYFQVRLPEQTVPMHRLMPNQSSVEWNEQFEFSDNCDKLGSENNPILLNIAGEIDIDRDGRYLILPLEGEPETQEYQLQGRGAIAVLATVDQPQRFSIRNNTDCKHVIPAGTVLANINSEDAILRLSPDDGVFEVNLNEIFNGDEPAIHTATAEPPSSSERKETASPVVGPRYEPGRLVFFTAGPRTWSLTTKCVIESVIDPDSSAPIYVLRDCEGNRLEANMANPEHRLSIPAGPLTQEDKDHMWSRLPSGPPAKPDSEPAIDLDSTTPPFTSDTIPETDTDRPWFMKLTLKELEAHPNYIKPTNADIQEMKSSIMWTDMVKSETFRKASPPIRRLMKECLLPFAALMSKSAPAGLYTGFKHDISVVMDAVIRSKQYPLRPEARAEIQKWLKKMLANGFIQRVSSPYRSPLLVVAKKTSGGEIKGWRIVFDARVLNSKTRDFDGSPSPSADQIWSELAGSRLFTTTDLKDAFYNIELTERAKQLTAFVDPRTGRQYGFTRLPMGLIGSPASMARLTASAFSDLQAICLAVYVDDLVTYTKADHIAEVKTEWARDSAMRNLWSKYDAVEKYDSIEPVAPESKLHEANMIHTINPESHHVTSPGIPWPDPRGSQIKLVNAMKNIQASDGSPDWANMPSVSLFSGIAGMNVGKTMLYCENDPNARAILKARMADGSITQAPIHPEQNGSASPSNFSIETLQNLPPGVQLLQAGWPCQDFSSAGKKAGIEGAQGSLFWHIIRLARISKVEWILLENVDAILINRATWAPIYTSLARGGYDGHTISLTASQAGAPHKRTRWFSLWHREREPSDIEVSLPPLDHLDPCGSMINGVYAASPLVQLPKVELRPHLVLKRWDPSENPCNGDIIDDVEVTRTFYVTPRCRGGMDANRNLTNRGLSDLASQLRFATSTPSDVATKGSQVNATFVEWMMGFAPGWTKPTPLINSSHGGWTETESGEPVQTATQTYHTTEPKGVDRLVRSSQQNAARLQLLGNACVPQQAQLALLLLSARFRDADVKRHLETEMEQARASGRDATSTGKATLTATTPVVTAKSCPIGSTQSLAEHTLTDHDFLVLTHAMQVTAMMESILNAGLRTQSKKTTAFATSVQCLGHLLTDVGLGPCPDKVKAMLKMKTPTNVSDVRSAMGAFSWFRRFIPLYSRRTVHMRALLKKGIRFEWTKHHENEFRDILQILSSKPLVTSPDPNKEVFVVTDGSCDGIGGMVYQLGDDPKDVRVIGYYSRSTTPAERNYCARELETLAVLATLNRFRAFLPSSITVLTDHAALQYLDSYVKSRIRLQSWSVALACWHIKWQFIPGKDNLVADWLSRHPIAPSTAPIINVAAAVVDWMLCQIRPDTAPVLETTLKSSTAKSTGSSDALDPALQALLQPKQPPARITQQRIIQSQIDDPQLRWIRAYLDMSPPNRTNMRNVKRRFVRAYTASREGRDNSADSTDGQTHAAGHAKRKTRSDTVPTAILKKFCENFSSADPFLKWSRALEAMQKMACTMMLKDNMLVLIQRPINKYLSRDKTHCRMDAITGDVTNTLAERVIVLGKDLVPAALYYTHASLEGAHQGAPGVVDTLARSYYWPTLAKDARDYVRNCKHCALAKQTSRDKYRIITSPWSPSLAFQVIYIDLVQIAINDSTRSYQGHTHILTVCCRLTRFVRLIPIALNWNKGEKKQMEKLQRRMIALPKGSAQREEATKLFEELRVKRASVIVATELVKEIFLRLHKVPQAIVTDNGSEFHNALLKRLTSVLGVRLRFITPLNARANYVERIHRPLGHSLKALINANRVYKDIRNWHRFLPYIEHRLNEHRPKNQRYSPGEMVLGRTDSLSGPFLKSFTKSNAQVLNEPTSLEVQALEDYADRLIEFQLWTDSVMKDKVLERQEANQKAFNNKQRFHEYKPGDSVAIYNKRIGKRAQDTLPTKLALQWHGPCTVISGGQNNYKVRLQSGRVIRVTTERMAPLSRDLMVPAEPKTPWKQSFPRSGADLFPLPGDHFVLLKLPTRLFTKRRNRFSRQRLVESEFYVVEFLGHCDLDTPESKNRTTPTGWRVRVKGQQTTTGAPNPYTAKYYPAYTLRAGAEQKVDRTAPQVIFKRSAPNTDLYESLDTEVRAEDALPMYAFDLNMDHGIPKRIQENIKALLHNRVANLP